MSIVKVTLPLGEVPVNGKQVSFVAPCDCTVTEALQIDGDNYIIVDALGIPVTGKGGRWAAGAVITVTLDVDNKRAFILNHPDGFARGAVGSYIGTGESGPSHPNSLTFDFEPKYLLVTFAGAPYIDYKYDDSDSPSNARVGDTRLELFADGPALAGRCIARKSGDSSPYVVDCPFVYTFSGNTVSWYVDTDNRYDPDTYPNVDSSFASKYQNNASGMVYHYVAIG